MGRCCPLCYPGEARAALGRVSRAQGCSVGMFPPEMPTSKAVCWACVVQYGCNLGEHCSGEALLALVSCHSKGSQPRLGEERERAKTAACGFVLWRKKAPDCALSLMAGNHPKEGLLCKGSKEDLLGSTNSKRRRRWKHRKAGKRCLGGPDTMAVVLAWVEGRKPGEQLWARGTSRKMEFS